MVDVGENTQTPDGVVFATRTRLEEQVQGLDDDTALLLQRKDRLDGLLEQWMDGNELF